MTDCLICAKPNWEGSIGVEIPQHLDGTWLKSTNEPGHGRRVEGEAHRMCYARVYKELYGVEFNA